MKFLKKVEQETKNQTIKTKDSGLELSLTALVILFILLIISAIFYQSAKANLIDLPPLVVLLTGISISAIIFILVHFQASSRIEAVRLAKQLTAELKREAEHRERQKALLEAILKNVGNAIIVLDPDNRVILMNNVATEYIELSDNNYQNKRLDEVMSLSLKNKDGITITKAIEQVLQTQEVFDIFPFGILTQPSGIEMPVRGNIEAIKTKEGQLLGTVISLLDITREVQLEQEKDDFISMAAHQFKTPVASLKWQIEMINDGDFGQLPDHFKEPMSVLSANADRVIKLVDDFLQIARISQKRVSDKPQLVNVEDSIRSILSEVEPIAQSNKISMKFESSLNQELQIEIDKQRLHDVFENLISNAIKYNKPDGTIKINLDQQADVFTLTVIDSGIGIPKDDQDQIFTRFFRASNAVKSKSEGTGLGLYMIRSYIEAWGGTISISSEENKGTTVTLRIPLQPKKHVLDINLINS